MSVIPIAWFVVAIAIAEAHKDEDSPLCFPTAQLSSRQAGKLSI